MSKIINLHNSINKYFSNLLETKYLENIILDKIIIFYLTTLLILMVILLMV